MKRFLLVACMVPGLAFAEDGLDRMAKYRQLFGQPVQMETRSYISAFALLDSVYTYQGASKQLTDKVHYIYDESGQKITELHETYSFSEEAFVTNVKSDYTYATIPGGQSVEEVISRLEAGKWTPTYKTITMYNQTVNPIAQYEYAYKEGHWMNANFLVSTEFDAAGYPTVLMDSTFQEDGTVEVMRMMVAYDQKHNADRLQIFMPGPSSGEWLPAQRAKLTYDEAGRQLSQYHEVWEEGAWVFSFHYTYTYDERGYMIGEVDKNSEFDGLSSMRYQNFYSDQVITKNESIHTAKPCPIQLDNESKTLSFDLEENEKATLTIINAYGAVVQRATMQQSGTLLVGHLKGYYIVHLQTASSVASQPVFVR